MFSFSKSLTSIVALFTQVETVQDRDDAFPAQSVDFCDLERRMRTVDERGRMATLTSLSLGLYPRG